MSDIPLNIQIIVITCSEERKRIMTDQLHALNLSIPFTFFQGYTPDTSKDYIVDRDPKSPEKDTMICCMRSHAAALNYFIHSFPDKHFALIIEDDAALLHNFEKELQAVMIRWYTHIDDIDFISLGYFPGKGRHEAKKSDRMLSWQLTSMVWGTQSYIVKRSAARSMATVLHHPSTKDLRLAFDRYLKTELKGQSYTNKYPVVQPDAMIPIGWRQAIVFPLMVIELPINSTITSTDNHVSMGMWEPVFTADGFRTKQEFYTLPKAQSAISLLKNITMKPRRLIVCADNRSPYEGTDDYWTYCIPMTEAYAKIIGVDFKFELIKDSIRGRHPAWTKIAVLSKYVQTYDEIMWFDSDATVINHKVNAFDYIKTAPTSEWKRDSTKKPILYALADKPFNNTRACSGIFLLDCTDKNSALKLLDEWWNDIPDVKYELTHPWEQAVWNEAWRFNEKSSYLRVADVFSMIDAGEKQVFIHLIGTYYNIRCSLAKKYFYRQLYPKQTRIGIVVRQQNYYTNGCGQNCIFMMQSLEALGYQVDLLVNFKSDKPDKVSEEIPLFYKKISEVKFEHYQTIIFGSEIPFLADVTRMKEAGVHRIMFNPCNVIDAFHAENFIYKCRETTLPLLEMTYKDIADEIWLTENHESSSRTYLEVLNKNKIPVSVVPLVWNPLFLKDAQGILPTNKSSSQKPLDIVIMEPNIGYCKNALIPLMICEKLCLEHPDLIHNVYLFNAPTSNPTATGMMEALDLWKTKKLRLMTRIPITQILSFFGNKDKHGDYTPVFLSHQINIPLNYAYYDALYTGFPFVHNSPSLHAQGLGYYYDGISMGASVIQSIQNTFLIKDSQHKAHTILFDQDPINPKCTGVFERLLNTSPLSLPCESVVINLDRRKDRYDLFQKNHPSFAKDVKRVSAVDGQSLVLTKDLVHLFRDNEFKWSKGAMGCALSHYELWKQMKYSSPVLVLEDDVLCPPDFLNKLNQIYANMPTDTDILFLGGLLPQNKEAYAQKIEQVNPYISKIKRNAESKRQYIHFCTSAYIITKQGAEKMINYVDKFGIHFQVDLLLCYNFHLLNIYTSSPLLTSVIDHYDTAYVSSNKTHLSDISVNPTFFTEEDIQKVTNPVQILVVTASDSRKAIMEQQFRDLKISYPIQYLEGNILDAEATDYCGSNVTPEQRRCIYSTRTHILALERAGLDTSPPFTLIVEDDIAIHKTEFISLLSDILAKYDSLVTPHSKVLSLGWIPCNPYSFYEPLEAVSTVNSTYKILQRFTPGTQAYLIKRSVAKEFTPLFKHTTQKALSDAILSKNHALIKTETQTYVFDDFGTKLLQQCVLFPPLVTEQPNTSLIRGTVENPYWTQFFAKIPSLRDQYWSLNHTRSGNLDTPLLITYDNKPTENTLFFLNTLKTNNWDHVLLGEGDVWEGWTTRMNAYRNYIKTLPDDKIVVLSDARDVVCLRTSKAFMEAFQSFKKPLVVCMETMCGGYMDVADDFNCVQCKPLTNYWKHHKISSLPIRKYVNNGLIAGNAKAIRTLLQWSIDNKYTDDQLALGNYVNTFPDLVALDTSASVLHTTLFGVNAGIQNIHIQKEDSPTFSEFFGRGAFFLHIPGCVNKGQRVIYESVCKSLQLGLHDKQLRTPYGYEEPTWNQKF